jgi:hypothetical protein
LGNGLDRQEIGVPFPTEAIYFSILHSAQKESGVTDPSKTQVPEILSPRVKQLERETNQSHSSSVELKNECSYTSTSPYAFMAWWLIN